ncbi:MAG TPA: acyl-CoA dehydrogenase family protein [Dehalococcoidia bacterium]
MEFRDTPEEARFRAEVRSFISAHLPTGQPLPEFSPYEEPTTEEARDFLRRWRQALAQKGWIAPHWPKEYGGAGMSVTEQFIFNEELAEARAPQVGGMGVQMIGPILILYGTEQQKREHLPKITSGEVQWCQGYSEPGAGSDLAGLQTRAVRDGDDYVINGQKIWTSGAHRADWMFMLARTDPEAPKHRGISMFLVDMKTPGITVQPLVTMAGDHVFNQEYFDNVRVPKENLVGEENRGWYIGAALLDFERSNIGASIGMKHTVRDLVQYVHEAKAGRQPLSAHNYEAARLELADRMVEAEVAKLISYRVISIQKRGGIPNYEASMNKLYRSEAGQRVARTGMKLLGLYGGLYRGSKWVPLRGRLSHSYLSSVSGTIAAGTSEINRNVIATRGLGLPRS